MKKTKASLPVLLWLRALDVSLSFFSPGVE